MERDDFEDFIIGLDMIPIFRLRLDERLEISQDIKIERSEIKLNKEENEITQCSVNFNEHMETDEFEMKIEHLDKDKREK